tara:strand:- start:40 stop:273 length:234 start_codon:yes stop_codon:yes gene_type:complete
MIAKLDTLKAKKKKSSEDLKISRDPRGGVFQKPNGVWVQEFDDDGHQNPLIRRMMELNIPIRRAETIPKGKSKKKTT